MQINFEIQEYIDKEVKHLEDKIKIINSKNSLALRRAEKEMDRRLEGMNEFREQLEKQTRTFLTVDEFKANERLINQKIDILTKMVYIGVGIIFVLQIVFRFIIN